MPPPTATNCFPTPSPPRTTTPGGILRTGPWKDQPTAGSGPRSIGKRTKPSRLVTRRDALSSIARQPTGSSAGISKPSPSRSSSSQSSKCWESAESSLQRNGQRRHRFVKVLHHLAIEFDHAFLLLRLFRRAIDVLAGLTKNVVEFPRLRFVDLLLGADDPLVVTAKTFLFQAFVETSGS